MDPLILENLAVHLPLPKNLLNRLLLRGWWHTLIREQGYYSCLATLLALPSDSEAIRYVADFGTELDLISGENCLVIVLGETEVRRSGLDEELWAIAVDEHVYEGHSVEVAKLFDIGFDVFPCLIVFHDIRSPEHILVTLKGMTAEEIADTMRSLFSIIQNAVSNKQNPLTAIEVCRSQESFRQKGQTIISQLRSLAGKTFETAMEAWIKATIT